MRQRRYNVNMTSYLLIAIDVHNISDIKFSFVELAEDSAEAEVCRRIGTRGWHGCSVRIVLRAEGRIGSFLSRVAR